jgi:hypothetical protein
VSETRGNKDVVTLPPTSWSFATCWRCSGRFSRRLPITGSDSGLCLECQMLHVTCGNCASKHEVLVMRGTR